MVQTTMTTAFQLYESKDVWDVGTLQHIYSKTSEPTATIETLKLPKHLGAILCQHPNVGDKGFYLAAAG